MQWGLGTKLYSCVLKVFSQIIEFAHLLQTLLNGFPKCLGICCMYQAYRYIVWLHNIMYSQ